MARVDFLVDGFNVYHSLKQASRDLEGAPTRWLDLRAFLGGYVQLFGKQARLGRVFYFSALAHHLAQRKEGVVRRHQVYLDALRSTGVNPVLGRFKKGQHHCSTCGKTTRRWEEKESDVAMGVKLLEVCVKDEADIAVLVTGDTDLVPAIRTVKELCPTKAVHCAFPYKRKNKELAEVAHGSFNISSGAYVKYQLPETVVLTSGRELQRPEAW